ncbi:hypothetical protein [Victivallis sp. Marseille-Q1083]|uniref:hypothetical protein n=1 Tax=Victivallis sp. Marseille-Q1083 TaxID=2717288 RepID=UPI00158A91BC|nr:hypothetical protein [Victivallis sp. Marseille-Q1083]
MLKKKILVTVAFSCMLFSVNAEQWRAFAEATGKCKNPQTARLQTSYSVYDSDVGNNIVLRCPPYYIVAEILTGDPHNGTGNGSQFVSVSVMFTVSKNDSGDVVISMGSPNYFDSGASPNCSSHTE